jgi:hypothetical protein
VRQNGDVTPRLGGSNLADCFADAISVQHTLVQATAKQLLAVAPGLFGNLHSTLGLI